MRKIYIMASTNTHTTFSSSVRIAPPLGSWFGQLGEAATRLARMIAEADEPAHVLRRKRYATLLG
jgi:hypothetical protein